MDRDYAVDGLNRATASGSVSLGYDARGNLTSSGSDAYGYDQFNLLTSGPGDVVAAYDPAGRLAKVADASNPATRFYYAGDALTTETVSGAIARRYVPGPGTDEPVVWYEGSGTSDRRWLQADERGSIVAVSDGSGAAIAINRYDEYGLPYCPLVSGMPDCSDPSANKGRFQYTGQMWIGELGLAYYKARMYSPRLGRFMQTDPIGYGDGLNWYNYVGSDPVNFVDPSGLCGGSGDTQQEIDAECITVTGKKENKPGEGSGGEQSGPANPYNQPLGCTSVSLCRPPPPQPPTPLPCRGTVCKPQPTLPKLPPPLPECKDVRFPAACKVDPPKTDWCKVGSAMAKGGRIAAGAGYVLGWVPWGPAQGVGKALKAGGTVIGGAGEATKVVNGCQ